MPARESTQSLPQPRHADGTPYTIALVCLGNICRSPMAEVVLRDRVETAGLDDRVALTSAGTGEWHIGDPMDSRAAAALTQRGYDASRHRVQQFDVSWWDRVDLVLVMDAGNRAGVSALARSAQDSERVLLFRAFDPRATDEDREVPDPFYGGDDGFEDVLQTVERTCDAIVATLAKQSGRAG